MTRHEHFENMNVNVWAFVVSETKSRTNFVVNDDFKVGVARFAHCGVGITDATVVLLD